MRVKKSLICSLLFSLIAGSIVLSTDVKAESKKDFSRIAGSNRYETSIQVSKKYYSSSKSIIIANGKVFADALSGGQLALALDAPILLSAENDVSDSLIKEVERLGAKDVYILGGESTISKKIERRFLGKNIVRLAGKDRYETSSLVMKETMKHGNFSELVLASGKSYPDALAASSYVYKKNALMILSNGDYSKVETNLNVVAIGGKNSLTLDGFNGKRIAGNNRYETASLIAKEAFGNVESAILASGENYPDALAAISMVKKLNSPILLVGKNNVYATEYLKNVTKIALVGGENSISSKVITDLDNLNNKGNTVEQVNADSKLQEPKKNLVVVDFKDIVALNNSRDPYDVIKFKNLVKIDVRKINLYNKYCIDESNNKFYNMAITSASGGISDNALFITYSPDCKNLGVFRMGNGITLGAKDLNIPTRESVILHFDIMDDDQVKKAQKGLKESHDEGFNNIKDYIVGSVEQNGKKYSIYLRSGIIFTPTTKVGEQEFKEVYRACCDTIRNLEGINGAKVTIDEIALKEYAKNEDKIELMNVLKENIPLLEDSKKDSYYYSVIDIYNKGNIKYGSKEFFDFFFRLNELYRVLH